MIRVTIELCPGGDTTKPQHLGTAIIWNDGTGNASVGHYVGTLSKWGKPSELWQAARVENFPRRDRGPWDLLMMVLVTALRGRSNPGVTGKRLTAAEVRPLAPGRARQQELGTQAIPERTES